MYYHKISASNCNEGKNKHFSQAAAASLKARHFSASLPHLLQHFDSEWLRLRNCLKLISQKTRKEIAMASALLLVQPWAERSIRLGQQEDWWARKNRCPGKHWASLHCKCSRGSYKGRVTVLINLVLLRLLSTIPLAEAFSRSWIRMYMGTVRGKVIKMLLEYSRTQCTATFHVLRGNVWLASFIWCPS